ncbi:MAG: hypothetical protein JNL50_08525 [Phycisphaerae bacterium]|nr:hypothetical protein [Phycisphaerae bacterium]
MRQQPSENSRDEALPKKSDRRIAFCYFSIAATITFAAADSGMILDDGMAGAVLALVSAVVLGVAFIFVSLNDIPWLILHWKSAIVWVVVHWLVISEYV